MACDPAAFKTERERRKFWRMAVECGWVEPALRFAGTVHEIDARNMIEAAVGHYTYQEGSGFIDGSFRGWFQSGWRKGRYAMIFKTAHGYYRNCNPYRHRDLFDRKQYESELTNQRRKEAAAREARWQRIKRLAAVLARELQRLERLKRLNRQIRDLRQPRWTKTPYRYVQPGLTDAETFANYYNALCVTYISQIETLAKILSFHPKP